MAGLLYNILDMDIKKINYKSDFTLRMHSDAGWGTGFRIRFRASGSPQKRYCACHDGNGKYCSCHVDAADPSTLVVEFDDHHMGIGVLLCEITYSVADESSPTGKFDTVVNEAPVVATIGGKEYKVILGIDGDESAEIIYELPAYVAEEQRQAAEAERQEAEAGREEAEAVRQELAAHPLYVGEDYFVYQYDLASHEYQNTGVYLKGSVSIEDFVYVSETETHTTYSIIFSDGTTESVDIPKGAKGDKGDDGNPGPQGAQGPKGDTVTATDYTLYNVQGSDSQGAMSQDATTKAISAQTGYYTCGTAAGTPEKVVTVESGNLYKRTLGGHFKVKMTNKNTAASGVTLQIGSETAAALWYNGAAVSATNTWDAGEVLSVYYDGSVYQASNAQGGSNRKIDAYLYGDVKALATGVTYSNGEAVVTTDKQLLKTTKEVGFINLADEIAIGDLRTKGTSTYKALKAVGIYNINGTYSEGAYAIGTYSTVSFEVTAGEIAGTIKVTVGYTTADIEASTDASEIATAIAAMEVEGWTLSSDGATVTAICNTIGNNTLYVNLIDTDSTGTTISTPVVVAGSTALRKYDGSSWDVVDSVASYAADTAMWESVDYAWLVANITEQNSVSSDILNLKKELFDEKTVIAARTTTGTLTSNQRFIRGGGTTAGQNQYSRTCVVNIPTGPYKMILHINNSAFNNSITYNGVVFTCNFWNDDTWLKDIFDGVENGSDHIIEVPAGANKIGFNLQSNSADTARAAATMYMSYISDKVNGDVLEDGSVALEKLEPDVQDLLKYDYVIYVGNRGDGELVAQSASYTASGTIKTEANTYYKIYKFYTGECDKVYLNIVNAGCFLSNIMCFFDSNNQFISSTTFTISAGTHVVKVPEKTRYVAVNNYKAEATDYSISKATVHDGYNGKSICPKSVDFDKLSDDAVKGCNDSYITIANSASVLIIGASLSTGHFNIVGKNYTARLSESTDYLFHTFAYSGRWLDFMLSYSHSDVMAFIRTKNITPAYVLISCFVNDHSDYTLNQYIEEVDRLCNHIRSLGAEPILAPEYTSVQSKTALFYDYARKHNCRFIDMARLCSILNPKNNYFKSGVHPKTRNTPIQSDLLIDVFNSIGRPNKSIKIFRKRPGVTVETLNDLRYSNIYERRRLYKELYLGANGCTPAQSDTNSSESGNAGVQNEYYTLMTGGSVSFTDYALIEVTLPYHVSDINEVELLFETTNTVDVYAYNTWNYEHSGNYYKGEGTLFGQWVKLNAPYTIKSNIKYYVHGDNADKIPFLIYGASSFSLKNIRVRCNSYSKVNKPVLRKEFKFETNKWSSETELLPSNTFGAVGVEDTNYNVIPTNTYEMTQGVDAYPPGVTSKVTVDDTTSINFSVASPSSGLYELELWCRFFPPVYTDGSDGQITVDSYDYNEVLVDVGGSISAKNTGVTLRDEVCLAWKKVRFTIFLSTTATPIKVYSNAKGMEVCWMSVKKVPEYKNM